MNKHCYSQHFLSRRFSILYENIIKAYKLIYVHHDFFNAKVKRKALEILKKHKEAR